MTILQAAAEKPVLEILAISDHEWRVCDGRFEQSDARRMLGYIDRTADEYELVRLQHQAQSLPPVESFGCLKDALDALLTSSGEER